jgi:hypothetical protein
MAVVLYGIVDMAGIVALCVWSQDEITRCRADTEPLTIWRQRKMTTREEIEIR